MSTQPNFSQFCQNDILLESPLRTVPKVINQGKGLSRVRYSCKRNMSNNSKFELKEEELDFSSFTEIDVSDEAEDREMPVSKYDQFMEEERAKKIGFFKSLENIRDASLMEILTGFAKK